MVRGRANETVILEVTVPDGALFMAVCALVALNALKRIRIGVKTKADAATVNHSQFLPALGFFIALHVPIPLSRHGIEAQIPTARRKT